MRDSDKYTGKQSTGRLGKGRKAGSKGKKEFVTRTQELEERKGEEKKEQPHTNPRKEGCEG
jgi:hypothetical protein